MQHQINRQLLGDNALLEHLFNKDDRPSRSWLRDQRNARKIPYIKISRQIFYDPEAVRKVLAERYTIREIS